MRWSAILLLTAAVGSACNGDGTAPPPITEEPTLTFAQLSAGLDRTCGVTTGGELYCWGRRFNGDAASRPALAPRRVPLAAAVRSVAVGTEHSCALLEAGAPICWGSGDFGALGRPVQGPQPVPGPGPQLEGALTRIVAGGAHSCGLLDGGEMMCWGRGLTGELGTGRIEQTPVPGRFGRSFYSFTAITAGQHHSCGIERDGRVLCSGWNVHGQLGVNATVNLGLPQHIISDERFAHVSAGGQHSCAITTAGAAWCWGRGDAGQLGTGATTGALVPVRVAGNHVFSQISAGAEHTCALTREGAPLCWGSNQFGRAGQPVEGAVIPQPAPLVTTLRFSQITAGGLHTCALTAAGEAWCWGFGAFGQLGNGATATRALPAAVAPPEPAAAPGTT
jgi:alpha-tubulin suppressor-like RCC1 family protein